MSRLLSVLTLTLSLLGAHSSARAQEPLFYHHPGLPSFQGALEQPALSPKMCGGFPAYACPWNYRTRIRNAAYAEGITFNGAFTVVEIGCGSGCITGFIVDRSDGRIYGPLPEGYGFEYRHSSSLIIVHTDAGTDYYVFRQGRFDWISGS